MSVLEQTSPHILLKVISTERYLQAEHEKFLYTLKHSRSDTPLLDIVASTVVDRHGQSAVAFASTVAGAHETLDTNLYLLFSSTPPPTVRSHLKSLFSLLRGIQRPLCEQERKRVVDSISGAMYRFSWSRWVYYLRKLLDSLEVIEQETLQLEGGKLLIARIIGICNSIRNLGVALDMDEEERIPFVVSTVARLGDDWEKRGFLKTKLDRRDKEPIGLFPRLEYLIRKEFGQCPPLHKWITKLLSIHANSTSAVHQAVNKSSFSIFRGSLKIVILPSPTPVPNAPDRTINVKNVETAVSIARFTHGELSTKASFQWNDEIFDDAVQDFIIWAASEPEELENRKLPHAHCQLEALNYIHNHGLEVYPHLGRSKSGCETCKIVIRAYFSAQGLDAPPIQSNGKIQRLCRFPEFGGQLGVAFRERLCLHLRKRVALTAIAWIDQMPVDHLHYWAHRKFQLALEESSSSNPTWGKGGSSLEGDLFRLWMPTSEAGSSIYCGRDDSPRPLQFEVRT